MIDYGFVLVHIPHSSTEIPEFYRKTILLNDEELSQEIQRMTDIFCDELYAAPGFDNRLVVPVSRLVCDMERFRDDKLELCAEYGQGLMYTKTHDGQLLRNYDEALRNKILAELYDPHHQKLTKMVDDALSKYGKCLIIDGHSFGTYDEPDFDIGTDSFHTPSDICDELCDKVQELGYSVKVNEPYAGTITPMKHYQKDKRVVSVMLETNRKLYEKDMKKSRDFEKTREVCHALMKCAADYVIKKFPH